MSVDDILLLARIAFVAAIYLFLFLLALVLRRDLVARTSLSDERAPGDLLIVEPHDTEYEPGERIPLLSQTTVGRAPDNDVVLDDEFVSTHHGRLTWKGKGWVLEDFGSTNGTQVNGHVVKKTTGVQPGDTIEFGRVKVKLVPV